MSYNTQRPYLAVFVILRKGKQAAFVLRTKTEWMNDHYGLPSGKVELGETGLAAAVRETREEAGVEVKESDLRFLHVCHRKSTDDTDSWTDLLFETAVWKGEPYNAEPSKHGELKWFDLDKLPENTVPSQVFELQQIEQGKSYSEFGW